MDITTELIELYTTAKSAGKLDLSFRILTHFAKIKPDKISLNMLSNDDLERIIAQSKALVPSGVDDKENEMNDEKF